MPLGRGGAKAKGYANEVRFIKDMGCGVRVYASGAGKNFDPKLGEDVDLPNGMKVQVKAYANKWMDFYSWLGLNKTRPKQTGAADVLAIRNTGQHAVGNPFLIVMPLELFKHMYEHFVEADSDGTIQARPDTPPVE